MSNRPDLAWSRHHYVEWLIAAGLLWALVLGVFSPAAVGLGWWLERKRCFGRFQPVCILGSLVWGIILAHSLTLDDWFSLKHWAYSLPLAPLASVTTKGVYTMSHLLKPRSLQEHLEDEKRKKQAELERLSRQAGGRRPVDAAPEWLSLGAKVTGDSLPANLGLAYEQGWLLMHDSIVNQHLFLLGATGVGKSETIKRLVFELLTKTERDIFLVDGKGEKQLADDIRALIYHHRSYLAPVFRLGHDTYGAIYDAFRGNAAAIDNRLRALIGVPEREGDSSWYANISRTLLGYICRAPQGPPRSFEEVMERLNLKWLNETYSRDPIARQVIEGIAADKRQDHLQGLSYDILPQYLDFHPCIGPEGFALEETRGAIFSIRTQSIGDSSRRFLEFLVEDFKDFVGNRQKRSGVLIIDEFGQFSNENIISLLGLARSAEMGVILATQDVATLKDPQVRQIVLANTRTKILMGSEYPEPIAELAGTDWVMESSFQHEDGQMTGVGTTRPQHAFKVEMNEAGQLSAGEAFVIRSRRAVRIKVERIGQMEPAPPQEEQRRDTKRPETEAVSAPKRKPRRPRGLGA